MYNHYTQHLKADSHNNALVKYIVSEKSTYQSSVRNCYVFEVPVAIDKFQIKLTIEKNWDVKVLRVRVMNRKSPMPRKACRLGYSKLSKVALVTLQQDDRLSFY